MTRIVVAGVGNEYRRDDGAGAAVARRLRSLRAGVTDIGPVAEPLDLLGRWDGAEVAVLIDAVRSGAAPGAVTVAAVTDPALVAQQSPTSTHGVGLARALRLARAVERCPRRVFLVGIEGREFGPGAELSPPVAAAVDQAARRVIRLIEEIDTCA